MKATSQDLLSDLAIRFPAASRLFHDAGLDFCCGGQRPLSEACQKAGLDADAILKALNTEEETQERWDETALPVLMDHILTHYHDAHRKEIPELIAMASKVEKVHGDKESCPKGLASHLSFMEQSLDSHMMKEEQVLFPMIRAGQGAMATMPVRVMTEEHDDHAANLKILRELATNYEPPAEACTTWRALYLRLNTFERDVMEHVHLENNVLFPRALRESPSQSAGFPC